MLIRTIIMSLGMLFSLSAFAITSWNIVPKESTLTFTATQNGSPVTGEFRNFKGDIQFDANNLVESHIKVQVDMASIQTSYSELTDALIASEWFDVKQFPQAVFTSTTIKKLNEKTYEAMGELTIRNKTLPISIQFEQESLTAAQAKVKGHALLERNAFGVGQGEWSATNEIKNEVMIDFVLTAIKAP